MDDAIKLQDELFRYYGIELSDDVTDNIRNEMTQIVPDRSEEANANRQENKRRYLVRQIEKAADHLDQMKKQREKYVKHIQDMSPDEIQELVRQLTRNIEDETLKGILRGEIDEDPADAYDRAMKGI